MKTLLLSTAIFLFSSSSSNGQNSDVETLKKLNREFLNAIVNKDTAALSNILADDFMLVNPGGMKRNKQDNLTNILTPNQDVISVDIDSILVRLLSTDVGWVMAWTTNLVRANGINSTFKICYLDIYMKRKTKWVAVAAHVTGLNGQ